MSELEKALEWAKYDDSGCDCGCNKYGPFLYRAVRELQAKVERMEKDIRSMPGWIAGEPAESFCKRLDAWYEQALSALEAK